MGERGVYLYAVGLAAAPPPLDDVVGLADEPVYAVTHGALVAAVSAVSLAEFGEEALRRNLEDLDWLAGVARRHDSVVQQLAHEATVAPSRLATIFFDDGAVQRRLEQDASALAEALRRIDGRHEWSVKAYSPAASSTDPAQAGEASGSEETGTAYLQRRRRERTQQEQDARSASVAAEALHEGVGRQTAASRRLPPQDPRLSGHDGQMVLNGAYLVDDARASEFRDIVGGLAADHPGLRIEVQGPWPPYSFATLEAG